jgi:hypothetical protein
MKKQKHDILNILVVGYNGFKLYLCQQLGPGLVFVRPTQYQDTTQQDDG